MKYDLTKPSPLEPDDMVDRFDLRCECGSHVLERPGESGHRFSCARYWRGKHGVCWAIASPESRWLVAACEGQLDLFAEAVA